MQPASCGGDEQRQAAVATSVASELDTQPGSLPLPGRWSPVAVPVAPSYSFVIHKWVVMKMCMCAPIWQQPGGPGRRCQAQRLPTRKMWEHSCTVHILHWPSNAHSLAGPPPLLAQLREQRPLTLRALPAAWQQPSTGAHTHLHHDCHNCDTQKMLTNAAALPVLVRGGVHDPRGWLPIL